MTMKKQSEEEPNVRLVVLIAVAILGILAFSLYWYMSKAEGGYVTGKVTMDNEPVANANVVFAMTGENAIAPFHSQTDNQGMYKLFGHNGPTVPVGNYKVTVTKLTLKDGKVPEGEEVFKAEAKGLMKNTLPKAYESTNTTPLAREVKSGRNVIDLELKK